MRVNAAAVAKAGDATRASQWSEARCLERLLGHARCSLSHQNVCGLHPTSEPCEKAARMRQR